MNLDLSVLLRYLWIDWYIYTGMIISSILEIKIQNIDFRLEGIEIYSWTLYMNIQLYKYLCLPCTKISFNALHNFIHELIYIYLHTAQVSSILKLKIQNIYFRLETIFKRSSSVLNNVGSYILHCINQPNTPIFSFLKRF